jgi:hypothetical protein
MMLRALLNRTTYPMSKQTRSEGMKFYLAIQGEEVIVQTRMEGGGRLSPDHTPRRGF